MAVNFMAYAQVRGYPKRSAGEDFYLLNKLNKVGAVKTLSSPLIKLEARNSARVPFGTGPAVARLLDTKSMQDAPLFYHPMIFKHLKAFITVLNKGSIDELVEALDQMDGEVQAIHAELQIPALIKHCRKQNLSGSKLHKHIHDWFDAFKTLKFIHLMRDKGLKSLSWNELPHQYRPK